MTVRDGFRFALSNLWQQKVRSLLTTTGVVIGVGAVVLMVSGGIGLKRQILKQFDSVEAMSSMLVLPVKIDFGKMNFGPQELPDPKPLTDQVIEDLRKLDGVRAVYPNIFVRLMMAADVPATFDRPAAVKKIWGEITGLPTGSGTGSLREALVAGKVWEADGPRVVITVHAAKALGFEPPEAAVGKQLRFLVEGGHDDEGAPQGTRAPEPPGPFIVVGVYDPEKFRGFAGGRVFLPIPQALRLRHVSGQDRMGFRGSLKKGEYGSLVIQVTSPDKVKDVAEAVKARGMGTLTPDELIGQINMVFLILEAFLGCLGGVGLLVAFVGIVNTMLMSILERTREIGIMKAVGARSRDIRRIFLVEAATIGLTGGVVGITLGWGVGKLLNFLIRWYLASKDGPKDVHVFLVSWPLAGAAMLFAILVSALAGAYPAMRAARLDPVRALRRE